MRDTAAVFAILVSVAFWALILWGIWRLARKNLSGRSSGPAAAGVVGDQHLTSLVVPRNETNSVSRATTLRDELFDRFEAVCRSLGIEVVAYKSPVQTTPVWAHFELAVPAVSENLSLRASARITVDRFDYHRFEHLLSIELTDAKRRWSYRGVIELDEPHLRSIVEFLTAPQVVRAPKLPTVRQHPLQLARPVNKIDRLGADWPAIGLGVLAVLILAIPIVGPFGTVGLFVYLTVRGRRRKNYVLTTGKPPYDPRLLRRLDSWQSNIYGLGLAAGAFRTELVQRLKAQAGIDRQISVAPEQIWYPGVDGKVEREQIVVRYRRAMAFVHVQAHGDDLYVGWDSHVNIGTWVEETLAAGIDRKTGKSVVAKRVAPGWQAPNEYDITDANFLTEWLHTQVVRSVRLRMEQHRIDQEIDFVIQRESRAGVLRGEEASTTPPARGGRFGGRLKRVA